MALFSFTLESFGITNTRSKHEDTDFVAFTLKLGSLDPQTVFKSMGNVNNGTHQVQLSFNGIEVDQDDTVLFNYLIVNAGSASQAQVETALKTVGTAWANGQGPMPAQMTSALDADLAWFNSQLKGILGSKCDGVVAAEQDRFLYGDLQQLIPSNIAAHQTVHAGTHSPSGCGNNSQYTVNWQAAKVTLVPDVVGYATDTPGSHPVKLYASPTLQKAGFATAWEHGTTGPSGSPAKPAGGFICRHFEPCHPVARHGCAIKLISFDEGNRPAGSQNELRANTYPIRALYESPGVHPKQEDRQTLADHWLYPTHECALG